MTQASPAIPTGHFRLVSYDDAQPPVAIEAVNGCPARLLGGWIRLSDRSWEEADSVEVTCSGQVKSDTTAAPEAGRLASQLDTLVFLWYRSRSNDTTIFSQGLLTHDTLRTDGQLFDGPPRRYIRMPGGL
jgi:hypothetical protein